MTNHSLIRTNHYGALFVGRCVLCGTEGLTMKDATKPCPNPRDVSSDEAVLDAIRGEQNETERAE